MGCTNDDTSAVHWGPPGLQQLSGSCLKGKMSQGLPRVWARLDRLPMPQIQHVRCSGGLTAFWTERQVMDILRRGSRCNGNYLTAHIPNCSQNALCGAEESPDLVILWTPKPGVSAPLHLERALLDIPSQTLALTVHSRWSMGCSQSAAVALCYFIGMQCWQTLELDPPCDMHMETLQGSFSTSTSGLQCSAVPDVHTVLVPRMCCFILVPSGAVHEQGLHSFGGPRLVSGHLCKQLLHGCMGGPTRCCCID